MKRLGRIVSIVPVIAKADTLTIEERQEFKERVGTVSSLHHSCWGCASLLFVGTALPPRTASALMKPVLNNAHALTLTDKTRFSIQWDLCFPSKRIWWGSPGTPHQWPDQGNDYFILKAFLLYWNVVKKTCCQIIDLFFIGKNHKVAGIHADDHN